MNLLIIKTDDPIWHKIPYDIQIISNIKEIKRLLRKTISPACGDLNVPDLGQLQAFPGSGQRVAPQHSIVLEQSQGQFHPGTQVSMISMILGSISSRSPTQADSIQISLLETFQDFFMIFTHECVFWKADWSTSRAQYLAKWLKKTWRVPGSALVWQSTSNSKGSSWFPLKRPVGTSTAFGETHITLSPHYIIQHHI